MNVTQMVEEVRSNAHELNETFLTDIDIIRYINRAQRRAQNILSRSYDEFFAAIKRIDVTGYQQIYDLPIDCVASRVQNVDILFNNEYYHLDQVSVTRTFNVYYQFSDLVPSHFQIRGQQLILYPTPSVTLPLSLIITYTKRVNELGKAQGTVTAHGTTTILASTAVSSVSLPKTFQMAPGSDLSSLVAYDELVISGSTANDDTYTIVSVDNTLKTITVSETIPDAVGPAFGNGVVSRDTITFDSLGDDIAVGSYITINDSVDAQSHGSFLIGAVNTLTNTITITPLAPYTTYRNTYISSHTNAGSIPIPTPSNPSTNAGYPSEYIITAVAAGDIATMTPAVAVSSISKDYHDYLVYYATIEVLKKAKEPIDEFLVSLKEATDELENAKGSRLAYETVRMTRGFGHYGD